MHCFTSTDVDGALRVDFINCFRYYSNSDFITVQKIMKK